MNRNSISIILAGLLLAALWGCGSSSSDPPAFQAGTHPAGWSAGTYHGVVALDVVKREQCTECHGKDLRGGISKISCYTCHTVYPHPAGWETPTQHGAQYLVDPAQCRACHGQDLKGGISKVSCDTCHPGYPHPVGWAQPLQHGYGYGANPQSCQQCHGADYKGGVSQVSCINDPSSPQPTGCHPAPAAIHTSLWKYVDHGKGAKLAPSSSDPFASFFTCQNCHGSDFNGTPLSAGYGCFSCHVMVGYPDKPPHSGSWNDPYNYSGATHTTTSPANAAVCFQCHNREQGPHIWLDSSAKPTDIIPNMLTPATGNPDPNAVPGCFNNTMCHGLKP